MHSDRICSGPVTSLISENMTNTRSTNNEPQYRKGGFPNQLKTEKEG